MPRLEPVTIATLFKEIKDKGTTNYKSVRATGE
jgi:hypothetical protein